MVVVQSQTLGGSAESTNLHVRQNMNSEQIYLESSRRKVKKDVRKMKM